MIKIIRNGLDYRGQAWRIGFRLRQDRWGADRWFGLMILPGGYFYIGTWQEF